MSVSGVSGSNGVSNTGESSVGIGQSRHLQELTGMSEEGVDSLVKNYAEKNGMSIDEAANELTHQLQNGGDAEGIVSTYGATELKEDTDEDGIPDFVGEMVENDELSQEDAQQLFQNMNISDEKVNSFFEEKPDEETTGIDLGTKSTDEVDEENAGIDLGTDSTEETKTDTTVSVQTDSTTSSAVDTTTDGADLNDDVEPMQF